MTNNLIKLLITLVCCLCFYNSLENEFVHDDIFAVVNNQDILPNTSIWNMFYNDFWGRRLIDPKSHKSFRPLCILTFRLNCLVFGMEPFAFHLVNVLLHVLVCNVLFQMFQDIVFMDRRLSLMATLLFTTHPVHVEAVTGVVGRADVLSCLFVLLAFKDYHKYLTAQKINGCFFTRDVITTMAYGSSTFFIKEHSVMVFFVLIGYDALRNRQHIASIFTNEHKPPHQPQAKKRFFQRVGLLLFWFFILFQFRMYLMEHSLPTFKHEDNPASFSPHLQTRLLTYLYLIIFNIKLLLSPGVLCYDWQIGSIPLIETLADARNLETLFGLSVFVIISLKLLIWFLKYQSKEEDPNEKQAIMIGLLFLVLPFLPASNFFIRVGFVVAERILYIPSIGFTILVVTGLNRICVRFPGSKTFVHLIFSITILLFSLKTIAYNRVWKTRETLFKSGVETLPHNAKAHYNYANYLKDENRTEQAIHHYKLAVKLCPPHSSSHNNLGALLQNDRPEEAEYHFNEAIYHTPGHYRAMFNLANIYRSRSNHAKARDILKTCLGLKPTYFDAKLLLADTVNELGQTADAIKLYQTLSKERYKNYQVNHNYASILLKQGQYEQAIGIYTNLLTKDPENENVLNNLATVYKKANNNEMAVELYQRTMAYHPKSSKAYENLAVFHYQRGDFQKSREMYEHLIQLSSKLEHKRNFAIVLFAMKEYVEAIKMVDENVQQQPNDMQSHYLLINFLTDIEEYPKGKVAIERALKISAGDQRVLLFKANILRNTKFYAEAIKIYKRLIDKNPKNIDALINLGTIYHIQDEHEDAMQQYRDALRIEPSNEIVQDNIKKLERLQNKSRKKKD